ncbi:MAG: plasmid mobilization protein [Thermoanaerobaculia bacterium]
MAKSKKSPAPTTKDDVIRMRVSSEQKTAIMAAAERDGLELSAWLRQLALRAAGALPRQEPKRK